MMRRAYKGSGFVKFAPRALPMLDGVCLIVLACLTFPSVRGHGADGAKAEPPAAKKKLETVTYYVGDLVERASAWRKTIGADAPDGIDGVAHVLMTVIDPESWGAKDADNAVIELHGAKLEVRATPDQHKQIAEVLAALRRSADATVVFAAELYEVDRAFFAKEVKPALGKGSEAAAIEQVLAENIRKEGKLIQSNKTTLFDGQASSVFSLRNACTYLAQPAGKKPYKTVFHGFSCRLAVTVTNDRRFIRLKLTRTVTDLLDVKKQIDPDTGKVSEIDVPKLKETSVTETLEVGDGVHSVLTVPYRPATLAKDKVLILLMQPVIRIEEEERERGKDDKTKIG
jgi:hypothetical protein